MPHFPACTICGLLIGDKILHEKYHREVDAKLRRLDNLLDQDPLGKVPPEWRKS